MLSDGDIVLACARNLRVLRTTLIQADAKMLQEISDQYSEMTAGLSNRYSAEAVDRAVEYTADWLDEMKLREGSTQFALAVAWKLLAACNDIYGESK